MVYVASTACMQHLQSNHHNSQMLLQKKLRNKSITLVAFLSGDGTIQL